MGDWFFTTTGADAPAAQHRQKPVLVVIFVENTREFLEIITSTGAKSGLHFCLSVLVLVIFQSPNKGMDWGERPDPLARSILTYLEKQSLPST